MARPEVQCGVGHMCRFSMSAPAAACTGVRPVRTGAGRLPVQKPTRWMSSSPEILRRACLQWSNEGLSAGDPKLHGHAVLQGKDASGANLTAAAAVYPPALCAAILRGIAAQHIRQ
eukprot:1939123-Alexandrium_andersonii.AAC.1